MRLFIALELSEEQRRQVTLFQARFKKQLAGVRWSKPESMHLTLKFIGDTDQAGLDMIKKALDEAARHVEPFNIAYSGCGVFPAADSARILWIGLGIGAETTTEIAEKLDDSLYGQGFKKERQPFKPHLTVGRIRQPLEEKFVHEYLKSGEDFQTSPACMSALTLFKSDLTAHGAIHEVIDRKIFLLK